MSLERESTSGGAVLVDPLGGLILEPSNELKFKGPFDDYVTVYLIIKNPTDKRIAFKIKTTAPKRYCVKPNSGVLDPSQSMKVNVLLQPFNYDPNEKNKHKFMVQYMYLNEQEMQLSVNDILNMWKDVPQDRLLDLKLKCIFELPDSDQNQQAQQKLNNSEVIKPTQIQSQSSPMQTKKILAKEPDLDFESASSSVTNTINSLNNQSNSNSNNLNSILNNSPVSRLDKNDNTLNELKLVKEENESLKKEINKLKEEEARLRKLALQSPSISGSNRAGQQNTTVDLLADLLNNRSSVIIISLLAIIIYLLLFR